MNITKKIILIDGRVFSLQQKGGISQFWAKLIASKSWRQRLFVEIFVYPGYDKNVHFKEMIKNTDGEYINLIESELPPSDNGKFCNIEHAEYRQLEITQRLRSHPDVVINTYYGENIFPECEEYLVVAYDFAHEEQPELAAKDSTKNVLKKKMEAFSSATKVIFISNTTRVKCKKYYTLRPNVITRVIYLGHDNFIPPLKKNKNQIIHVGSRSGYKNYSIVDAAMFKLMLKFSSLSFFVFGGEPDDGSIKKLMVSFPGRVSFSQLPSDIEIDCAMMTSSYFISASKYEGFGIPLLNALRFGTIPIVSKIDVYQELAGDDAIYFDPISSESLIRAVEKGLSSDSSPYGYWRPWEEVSKCYLTILCGNGC